MSQIDEKRARAESDYLAACETYKLAVMALRAAENERDEMAKICKEAMQEQWRASINLSLVLNAERKGVISASGSKDCDCYPTFDMTRYRISED